MHQELVQKHERDGFHLANPHEQDPFAVDLATMLDEKTGDDTVTDKVKELRRLYHIGESSPASPLERACTMSPINEPFPLIAKLEMTRMGVTIGSENPADQRSSAAHAIAAAAADQEKEKGMANVNDNQADDDSKVAVIDRPVFRKANEVSSSSRSRVSRPITMSKRRACKDGRSHH